MLITKKYSQENYINHKKIELQKTNITFHQQNIQIYRPIDKWTKTDGNSFTLNGESCFHYLMEERN